MMISPKSIRKEILSPTEKISFSVDPRLFSRSKYRMSNPGKIVKKVKPKNCRKKGTPKVIAISVTASSITKINRLLLLRSLNHWNID